MHERDSDKQAEIDARHDASTIVREARLRMVARARTPWWYPPAYGLSVGGMVASLALPPRRGLVVLVGCLACLLGVYALWQRTSGLRVHGLRAGRTRRIALGVGSAIALALVVALSLRDRFPNGEAALGAGAVLAVVAAIGSGAWDRAWRAELRGDLREDLQ